MGRDVSRDRGGDQAAWRDLVARFELPSAIDSANAPWPDSENLVPSSNSLNEANMANSANSVNSVNSAESASVAPDRPAEPPAEPVTPTAPDTTLVEHEHGGELSDPGKGRPANRGRVIRPASFLQWVEPVDGQQPQHIAGVSPRKADDFLAWPAGGREPELPQSDGGRDGEQTASSSADFGFIDFDTTDDEDQDECYVPPYVPPQPKLDPVARGAWTALFGGPGYLFLATTLGWQVPGWAELAAIIAFIAGFVILVSRLGDGPSRRDGPDQGAVV